MTLPVNFDSVGLDGILADWLCALREQGVEAVLVLGPDPLGGRDQREVLAVHPPRLLGPAHVLGPPERVPTELGERAGRSHSRPAAEARADGGHGVLEDRVRGDQLLGGCSPRVRRPGDQVGLGALERPTKARRRRVAVI